MQVKISKHSFSYWGDLHSDEWFQKNRSKLPDVWEGIEEIGWDGHKPFNIIWNGEDWIDVPGDYKIKNYKGIKSFRTYMTWENKYVAAVKNLIKVFGMERIAICYKKYIRVRENIRLNVSSNEVYHNIDCGYMFQLSRKDIYDLIRSYDGKKSSGFIFEILLRFGIRGVIAPFVLRDADDRNTRIYVSDNMYIYGKSGKLTSLDQLTIPKGLNVRRYTRGFPYG